LKRKLAKIEKKSQKKQVVVSFSRRLTIKVKISQGLLLN